MLADHRGELLSVPGVTGIGRGEREREPCIVVFVDHPTELPTELDGYPVSTIETGPISALPSR